MTKDDIITKLERAQDLLAEVYYYAITNEITDLESLISTADGCICDGLDALDFDEPDFDEPDFDDNQPDESQEWESFDPDC
jgi:hypothetical protein